MTIYPNKLHKNVEVKAVAVLLPHKIVITLPTENICSMVVISIFACYSGASGLIKHTLLLLAVKQIPG